MEFIPLKLNADQTDIFFFEFSVGSLSTSIFMALFSKEIKQLVVLGITPKYRANICAQ